MKPQTIQIIDIRKILEPFYKLDYCEVSKARAEIILEQFCNGKKIDFPFSKLKRLFG